MKQRFELEHDEIEAIAENAANLFSWLQEDEAEQPTRGQRVAIPTRFVLVATTIVATGLPILLDQSLPSSACWFGNCRL